MYTLIAYRGFESLPLRQTLVNKVFSSFKTSNRIVGVTEPSFSNQKDQLGSTVESAVLVAELVLSEFDKFYLEFQHLTAAAKTAFEQRAYGDSLRISEQKLALYSTSMYSLSERLSNSFPSVLQESSLWDVIESDYQNFVSVRYEADLAIAYFHSVRRAIFRIEWSPVAYSFGIPVDMRAADSDYLLCATIGGVITHEVVTDILSVPGFSVPYRDPETDVANVANRMSEDLQSLHPGQTVQSVEVIKGGFYRNRGVYIVGRIVLANGVVIPLILALLNSEEGIYVDAVLTKESAAHNLFSTTRANFNVTNTQYHEVSEFLYSIMPKRPLGLHYSTIGFNHFGKVAVMDELKSELLPLDRSFCRAIGYPGTVAIGFHSPDSTYNLKVIRNKPTAQYKWGEFEGLDRVLEKYSQVHDINRTGSMLDNIIYYNVKLERKWFDDELLRELLCEASETVTEQGDSIVFKHLIVQRRMTPLPVYLETASPENCEMAVVNLGYCIKNNTAANVFNRDLDARNYGVGGFMRVYLFDYDALTAFTEVKIRSNRDRYDGEEDIPDWVFEEGEVFLPEEIEWGLRIPSRRLRQLFREVHGDLLRVDYWEQIQVQLQKGRVPSVRVYPERDQLHQVL